MDILIFLLGIILISLGVYLFLENFKAFLKQVSYNSDDLNNSHKYKVLIMFLGIIISLIGFFILDEL